jgi:flagellar hook-length control protein FliK
MLAPKLMDLAKAAPAAARPARRAGIASKAQPIPDPAATGDFATALAAQQQKTPAETPQPQTPKTKVDKRTDDSAADAPSPSPAVDKSQDTASPAAQSPSDSHSASQNEPNAPPPQQSEDQAPTPPSTTADGQNMAQAAVVVNATPTLAPAAQDSTPAPQTVASAKPVLPAQTPPSLPNAPVAQEQSDTPPQDDKSKPQAKQSPESISTASTPPESHDADKTIPVPTTLAEHDVKPIHEKHRFAAHVPALESDVASADPAAPSAVTSSLPAPRVEAALIDDPTASLAVQKATPESSTTSETPLNLVAGTPHAAPARAELAPTAQESPRAASADTLDQIVLGLKAKFDARSGKAEIMLNPPNLGTMKVSLSLDNGLLTAEFQSPSSVVRDLLNGSMEKLKTVLQDQGVVVDRLAVQAPPDSGASSSNPQASFGSATHDGRSAGHFQQDSRPQQRSPGAGGGGAGEGFARLFAQAQDAPLDLVA